jgi:hypothetical protein
VSIGTEICLIIWREAERALLRAEIITTGWMLCSRCGRHWARTSPAEKTAISYWSRLARYAQERGTPKMITLVVPSPTSSSCVRLRSIMFFAAG